MSKSRNKKSREGKSLVCQTQSHSQGPMKSSKTKDTDKGLEELFSNLDNLTIRSNEVSDDDRVPAVSVPIVPSNLPKHVVYYGWFFNNEVSLQIKQLTDKYLLECLKIGSFRKFMDDICLQHDIKNPDEYYRKPGKKKPLEELKYHLTAKFFGGKPCMEYSSAVHPLVGNLFRIHLVGLFFTPQTFGVRVKLTNGQKEIFDEERLTTLLSNCQQNSSTQSFLTSKSLSSSSTSTGGHSSSQISIELVQKELENFNRLTKYYSKYEKSKSSLTCIHSNLSRHCLILPKETKNIFSPTKSRAHITIGCAPKVKAIQTGVDLLEIIEFEERITSPSVTYQDYEIDGGTLRQFGRFRDAFVVYPCHQVVTEASFNYCV